MTPRPSSGPGPWFRRGTARPAHARRRTSRRLAPLLAVALAAAVAPALAGSPAVAESGADNRGGKPAPATGDVVIGHAGVLTELVRTGLTPALAPRGITVESQGGNTLAVARDIRDGALPADLFGSADANANQLLTGKAGDRKVRWFATFARNSMVVLYSPKSRYLAEFEKAARGEQPWYAPLGQPGVTLARSDPDDDPGGYFTLFVAQLAERSTGEAGLKQRILGDDRNPAQVIGPASGDVGAKLLSGEIDAVFAYSSFAASTGVPYLTLPPEVNLSDPAHARDYASASFTNSEGETFRGGVIYPTIAPVEGAANPAAAQQVLTYLLSREGQCLLAAKNFLPGPLLVGGDRRAVPPELRRYFTGTYPPKATSHHHPLPRPPKCPRPGPTP